MTRLTLSPRVRSALGVLIVLLALPGGLLLYVLYPPAPPSIAFPGGKRFALSIVDDTDLTTLDRIRPLYDVLHAAGLRTTKTVWVLDSNDQSLPTNGGVTLRDPHYRSFITELHRKGFEIALHGVRGGSSPRLDTLGGLEDFRAALGHYPRLHVNHAGNRDNLYWGSERWWFPPYRWAIGLSRPIEYAGHEPGSTFFWGDVAKERIRYVRRFTYTDIDVLGINPFMPYRVVGTPFVNYWFDAADGGSIDAFDRLLHPSNLNRLEARGGVSLIYAHLGAGSFSRDGRVDPRFIARISDVSRRNGWFAPVSEILDFLSQQPGWNPDLNARQMLRLETMSLGTLVRRDSFR